MNTIKTKLLACLVAVAATTGAFANPDPGEMYHNTLSAHNEDIKVAHGMYGEIAVPLDGYYATAFDVRTTLGVSGAGIGGSYAPIIQKVGDRNDTRQHTFVGWFRVDDLSAESILWFACANGDTNKSLNGYKVCVTPEGKIKIVKTSHDAADNGTAIYSANVVMTAGKWAHVAVAFAWGGSGERTLTPTLFVNGIQQTLTGGTTIGSNLNGDTGAIVQIGAGVKAAGVYVDTAAIDDAAKVVSLATNAYYLEMLDTMYVNRLNGASIRVMVPGGMYGGIEVPKEGYFATAFDALTTLTRTADNSYADIIKDDNIDTHTLAGWFKVDALPTGSNLRTIYVAKSSGGTHCGYKVAVDKDGKLLVGKTDYASGNYTWNSSEYRTTAEPVVTANTWVHLGVALLKSDGDRTVTPFIYTNGAPASIGSGTFAANLNGKSCTDLMIGAGVTAAGIHVDRAALEGAEAFQYVATNEKCVIRTGRPVRPFAYLLR